MEKRTIKIVRPDKTPNYLKRKRLKPWQKIT